jgi:hypothetical protein
MRRITSSCTEAGRLIIDAEQVQPLRMENDRVFSIVAVSLGLFSAALVVTALLVDQGRPRNGRVAV